ncbi:MAG: hypothetical protein ACKVJ7_04080, partial [Candidatus Poseidoniales archaeon]
MMSKQVLRASSLVLIMVIASLSPLLNHESESTLKDEPISMLSNPALDVDFNWWEVDHPAGAGLGDDVGGYTSTAVDSYDEVHVAYYDDTYGDLKYATYDGSSWTTSTVDSTGDVGRYTSIAIDSNDNLHISYYDDTNDDLKYATYDGSSWTDSTVDSTGTVGFSTSIAIDSNDNLHI